jgi:polysaccharide deacetylase family protein (PEP-CTERM system associated)
MKKIRCVFSIDFEDWYQGFEIFSMDSWKNYQPRIERNCDKLLELLGECNVKATFFILGYLADKYPHLIDAIHKEDHELGVHGYSHTQVFRLDPEKFDNEIKSTSNVIADITGKKPLGFRAPIFSMVKDVEWAYDVLVENGFKYDSSILPTFNYRYGIVSADRFSHEVTTERGNSITEIPITTARFFNFNLPVGGGAYFRIWPYRVTRWGFNQVLNDGKPAIFYMHPWEIDTEQPRIKLPPRLYLTHYTGLGSTVKKLRRLFKDFAFSTISDVFDFEY